MVTYHFSINLKRLLIQVSCATGTPTLTDLSIELYCINFVRRWKQYIVILVILNNNVFDIENVSTISKDKLLFQKDQPK